MKTKKYMEFKEKFLPECCRVFYEEICVELEEHKKERIASERRQLEQVLGNIAVVLDGALLKIGCIQISLLLSSIEKKEPEFMYEVYDGGMDFGTLLLAQTMSAGWLLPFWNRLEERIRGKIEELEWQQYLRSEAVKTLCYESVDGLILILAFQMKYEYTEFPSFSGADAITKEDGFYVSFGEYRGWKKILYQYTEEKDIFRDAWEKDYSFMRLLGCKYEKKRFTGQKLVGAVFSDCVFLNTEFSEVDFRDAVFNGCVFRECEFTGCRLHGCEFRDCDMQRIRWEGNRFESGLLVEDGMLLDVCRKSGFYHTLMHKHTFADGGLKECLLKDCDLAEVEDEGEDVLCDTLN